MSVLSPERLAELEYEACQSEKRDRMNARLQVWSILIGLVGAFGVASFQAGAVGYVVALYPLLAACVARHSGHSEGVLEQIKAYLHLQEEDAGYSGYEHFNKSFRRRGVGSHMMALRDAIVLTDLLAVGVVVVRLVADQQVALVVGVLAVEVAAMVLTLRWLRGGLARNSSK
jgi:hypothetical protein